MSDPSSTTSPRSSPISAEDADALAFDGARDVLRAWLAGLRPDPDLTVSEWADRHRKLSSRASAAITAGFEFDVPVRFDTDVLDVTLDLERLGSITSIPLL